MKYSVVMGAAALAASAGLANAGIDSASPAQLALGNFAVQDTYTSFGSNNSLANAKAAIAGGNLNLLFGGKLNNSFEKLAVYFDTVAGGANTVPFTQGANNGGMTFDAPFSADFALVLNGDGSTLYIDATSYVGSPTGFYVGSVGWSNGGVDVPSGGTESGIRASINNQGAGIPFGFSTLSGGDAAAAAAYATGMGISIPLSLLGIGPTSTFAVSAMILGGDGSTLSTQLLGGVQGSIGGYSGAGGYNFNGLPGNQFFVIPTPGAMALLGVGGLLAARRRR